LQAGTLRIRQRNLRVVANAGDLYGGPDCDVPYPQVLIVLQIRVTAKLVCKENRETLHCGGVEDVGLQGRILVNFSGLNPKGIQSQAFDLALHAAPRAKFCKLQPLRVHARGREVAMGRRWGRVLWALTV